MVGSSEPTPLKLKFMHEKEYVGNEIRTDKIMNAKISCVQPIYNGKQRHVTT